MFSWVKEFIEQSIRLDVALFMATICFCAWFTHIIHCYLAIDKFLFLFLGAFIFPIGIIHGFSLWFDLF